jgi:hypothetical protein
MTPAEILTDRLGGRWHGHFGACLCPAHDDRNPSLTVRDGESSPLVTCHAGCVRINVLGELRWRGLWPIEHRSEPKPRREGRDHRQAAHEIWSRSRAALGTLAERYWRSRGLVIQIPPTLRFHPAQKHADTGSLLPAMVAAVQAPDRSISAIHRTFLRADGAGKAQVSSPRKMLGSVRGCAVRLAAAGPALAIGEGIETCAAYMQITGMPAWAAMSASGLMAIGLPPLPLASTVFILTDLDAAGERAAEATAARLDREERIVKIVRPTIGNDIADALVRSVAGAG